MSSDRAGPLSAGGQPQGGSRFGPGKGKLYLVLLDDKSWPALRGGRSLWGVARTLTYRPGDRQYSITVPRGFPTDLASIPRWGWILLPPDGPWAKAAIIHDYLYATRGTGVLWAKPANPEGITRPQPYTRRECDQILREAMEDRGVGWFKRWIIYLAVRIGGHWDADRTVQQQPPTPEQASFVND